MVLVYKPRWWRKLNGSVVVKVAVAVADLFFIGHIKCFLISKCPTFPDTHCRHDLRVLSSSCGLGWLAFKLKHNAKCALCFQSRGLWAAGVWLLGTFMSETARHHTSHVWRLLRPTVWTGVALPETSPNGVSQAKSCMRESSLGWIQESDNMVICHRTQTWAWMWPFRGQLYCFFMHSFSRQC